MIHELWWTCECRRIYSENSSRSYTPNRQTDINKWFNSWTYESWLKTEPRTYHLKGRPTCHSSRLTNLVVRPLAHYGGPSPSTASYTFLRSGPLILRWFQVSSFNGDHGSWRRLMMWRFLAPYSTSIPCPPTPPRFLAPYSTSAYI
jgi:hypothetical protein